MKPTMLDLKTMLPIIRKAFDEKTLQMFTWRPREECLYSGPCAIGVCLTPEQRDEFDHCSRYGGSASLTYLFSMDKVGCATGEKEDVIRLQRAHDFSIGGYRKVNSAAFENILIELEKKYLGDD